MLKTKKIKKGSCKKMTNKDEYQKIQPTLTEDERVILRNIPKEYIKIRREKYTKNIYIEKEKIENEEDWEILLVFNHLFQFIKERRNIFYKKIT